MTDQGLPEAAMEWAETIQNPANHGIVFLRSSRRPILNGPQIANFSRRSISSSAAASLPRKQLPRPSFDVSRTDSNDRLTLEFASKRSSGRSCGVHASTLNRVNTLHLARQKALHRVVNPRELHRTYRGAWSRLDGDWDRLHSRSSGLRSSCCRRIARGFRAFSSTHEEDCATRRQLQVC